NCTCREPLFTPTISRSSRSRTPVHIAFPIAPLPHCPPGTRGCSRLRLLPEHWFTAAIELVLNLVTRLSRASVRGLPTFPSTRNRHSFRSTEFGRVSRCQRT